VRAVVEPPHRVGLGRAEAHDAHARLLHLVDEPGVHLHRPDGVEDDVALDPRAGPLAQRPRDVDGDVALPVDVGEQADGAVGAAQRLEEAGEDLVAVDQQLDGVAVGDRGAGERLGGAQEPRPAGVGLAVEVVAVAALPPVSQ
jgi:hypothetical protein